MVFKATRPDGGVSQYDATSNNSTGYVTHANQAYNTSRVGYYGNSGHGTGGNAMHNGTGQPMDYSSRPVQRTSSQDDTHPMSDAAYNQGNAHAPMIDTNSGISMPALQEYNPYGNSYKQSSQYAEHNQNNEYPAANAGNNNAYAFHQSSQDRINDIPSQMNGNISSQDIKPRLSTSPNATHNHMTSQGSSAQPPMTSQSQRLCHYPCTDTAMHTFSYGDNSSTQEICSALEDFPSLADTAEILNSDFDGAFENNLGYFPIS